MSVNEIVIRAARPANGTEMVARARRNAEWVERLARGEESVLRVEAGTGAAQVGGFFLAACEHIEMTDPHFALLRELTSAMCKPVHEVTRGSLGQPGASDEQMHETFMRRVRGHKAECSTPGCMVCVFAKIADQPDGDA